MKCPRCGGTVTVVPGKEGRVMLPMALTYYIYGDKLSRVSVVSTFNSCNECEHCWRD